MEINEVVTEVEAHAGFLHEHVTNQADAMPLEDLVAVDEALAKLAAGVKMARDLIAQEQAKRLESGARQIGRKVYARVRKFKDIHDHAAIRKAIRELAVERAIDKETGEINAGLAVDYAVDMMADTYTAPSSKAKVGMIDKLGLARKDVIQRERVGWEVQVTDTDPDDPDDE